MRNSVFYLESRLKKKDVYDPERGVNLKNLDYYITRYCNWSQVRVYHNEEEAYSDFILAMEENKYTSTYHLFKKNTNTQLRDLKPELRLRDGYKIVAHE